MNYLIIKKDGRYFVEEVETFNIKNVSGQYLTSTTHKLDAYNATETLNYLISKT